MNVLNINDNPLAFLGDIHGKWEVVKHYFELYSISNIKLVQVGDFGVGYKKKDEESQLLNELSLFLKEKNSFLYVIRGNHDNPSYFQKELIDTLQKKVEKHWDNEVIFVFDCWPYWINKTRKIRSIEETENWVEIFI